MRNLFCFLCSLFAFATPAVADDRGQADEPPKPVIEPQIDRRDIVIPDIDADDIEVGLYGGLLSVEDFGTQSLTGVRVGYHLTEDFFVEAAFGRSTVSDEQFRTLLPSGVFETPEVDLDYWLVSMGYHFLPGEVFLGEDYAFGSGVYLVAGIGNVEFADVSATAFSFGLGVRALPSDGWSVRLEMRDHVFDQDVLGVNKRTHNFELTLGVSMYF